jgi:hypothetical protein
VFKFLNREINYPSFPINNQKLCTKKCSLCALIFLKHQNKNKLVIIHRIFGNHKKLQNAVQNKTKTEMKKFKQSVGFFASNDLANQQMAKRKAKQEAERVQKNHETLKTVMLAIIKKVTDEGEDKPKKSAKPKKLTKKKIEQITRETKAAVKSLSLLPPSPFSIIIPAPKLSKKTPLELVAYCEDKLVRVSTITAFAGCLPSVPDVTLICDALYPLAGISRKDITSSELTDRKDLVVKLKNNFALLANSCAVLAAGNLPLFALTAIATKTKGTRNTTRLAAPVVTLNTKLGGLVVGAKCKPVKFAKSYTVKYWKDGDITNVQTQVGKSSQVVINLIGGELMNFIMTANTGTMEGFPSVAQRVNVPFD